MLREAVRLAIVSSHVHPEAVDGAFLIAKTTAFLTQESAATFNPILLLSALEGALRPSRKLGIGLLICGPRLGNHACHPAAVSTSTRVGEEAQEWRGGGRRVCAEGSLRCTSRTSRAHEWRATDDVVQEPDFQLKTRDAVPCALWAVARYGSDPVACIIEAVNFGGDTDTVGAIGAYMSRVGIEQLIILCSRRANGRFAWSKVDP